MSLVWIIPALGVSLLTVAVVLQLIEEGVARPSDRLNISAVGALMLLEGALLLAFPGFSAASHTTTATHGVAMMVAGAGIWTLTHRLVWSSVASGKSQL